MSNNEKKSSLAELLEEYFPGAGKDAEQVLKDKFGSFPDEGAETVSEEIISLDGSEEDDTEEVPDEPFEVPEEDEETEPEKTGSEFSTLS
ncbi:MAG: hypothetical protein K2J76_05560, partial [Oscillospiraceae bacterium]|nr:hypothetical protein [Oscillospiraceae bacterium]